MTKFLKLMQSLWGLSRILGHELSLAIICHIRGNRVAAADHLRFAILTLHDDLSTLAGQLKSTSNLPSANLVDRILIVKLDRVGDMVNTTPVFDFLLEQYPNAKLDIVGHPAVLTLLDGDPRISNQFSYKSALYHPGPLSPPGLSQLRLIQKLLKTHYPLVVYLRGSFPFLSLAIRSHFVATKFVEGEPVIRRYLKPLGACLRPDDPLPVPSLRVSRDSREKLISKYPNIEQTPHIVIHGVAAGEGRQWPLERFARIADEIHLRSGAKILFIATPPEKEKLDQIQASSKCVHLFETSLSLPEAVAAIALAHVFIGNDSGLAHIAAAVRTREVVIWGAANLAMARPQAAAGHCSVLYHEVDCRRGCPEIRCNAQEHLKCLRTIDEASVVSEALNFLTAASKERLRLYPS